MPAASNGVYTTADVWKEFDIDNIITGVVAIAAEGSDDLFNVYNMQGVMLRRQVLRRSATEDLHPGFYRVGEKKEIVIELLYYHNIYFWGSFSS